MSEVPYLKQVTLHQMDHPQVTAVLTSLRTFFSMDYVQAGLFFDEPGLFGFLVFLLHRSAGGQTQGLQGSTSHRGSAQRQSIFTTVPWIKKIELQMAHGDNM